jgi:transcriptional regulator with XRE-family HTH domain
MQKKQLKTNCACPFFGIPERAPRPPGMAGPSNFSQSMSRWQRKSSGRMASKGFPNPIDVHVGARIRLRRTLLGLSQERLAEAIGLTFQQVQKYESGANRVSSSRLVDLANVLDVSVSYFFEEMSAGVSAQTPSALMRTKQRPKNEQEADPLARRETLELMRANYRITDPVVRKRLADLVKAVGKGRAA